MEGIIIRDMLHNDLPEIITIEQRCHATPWNSNSFEYEVDNRDAILKVAVLNGRIIGYVCIRTILDMTHLLNISVLPGFRRVGIGSMLMHNVLQALKMLRPDEKVTLEVRQSNHAAIKLYEKIGFHASGTRRGYYSRPDEDAIIMAMDLKSVTMY